MTNNDPLYIESFHTDTLKLNVPLKSMLGRPARSAEDAVAQLQKELIKAQKVSNRKESEANKQKFIDSQEFEGMTAKERKASLK